MTELDVHVWTRRMCSGQKSDALSSWTRFRSRKTSCHDGRSTITNRKCQMQAYLNLKLRSMNDKC